MEFGKALCSRCGLDFYASSRGAPVGCVNPETAEVEQVGTLHAVMCPRCRELLLEFTRANADEAVPLYYEQGATT